MHDGNCSLSDDEEGMLVNMAMFLASSGRGIRQEELLELMNTVILEIQDQRTYVLATLKSVQGLIKQNDKLRATLTSAGSLDPARAAQAKEEKEIVTLL